MTNKQIAIHDAAVAIADHLTTFCQVDREKVLTIANAITESDNLVWSKSPFYAKTQEGGE